MQEGYITVFFFLFPAVTRFVDFLTLIRGCVFMCLFARLGLRFLWSVAFWKPQISSMTEAQMAQCNPEVSLLITVRSHSHSVKAVGSKVLEWWFMSTISHAERMAWKHEEKMPEPMCYSETVRMWQMLVVLMVWNKWERPLTVQQLGASCNIHWSLFFLCHSFFSTSYFLPQLAFLSILLRLKQADIFSFFFFLLRLLRCECFVVSNTLALPRGTLWTHCRLLS